MIIKNLPQKTILKETQLSGIGLHSGDQINKIKALFLFALT